MDPVQTMIERGPAIGLEEIMQNFRAVDLGLTGPRCKVATPHLEERGAVPFAASMSMST